MRRNLQSWTNICNLDSRILVDELTIEIDSSFKTSEFIIWTHYWDWQQLQNIWIYHTWISSWTTHLCEWPKPLTNSKHLLLDLIPQWMSLSCGFKLWSHQLKRICYFNCPYLPTGQTLIFTFNSFFFFFFAEIPLILI